MMPMCTGGLTDCPNTAVFLGPHESPALCDKHFAELLDRVQTFFKKREKDPLAPTPFADHEIENAQIEGILNDMGRSIGSGLPAGWGFNLLIFSFGEKGSMFYISNAQRADMLEAMREFIAKQEAKS